MKKKKRTGARKNKESRISPARTYRVCAGCGCGRYNVLWMNKCKSENIDVKKGEREKEKSEYFKWAFMTFLMRIKKQSEKKRQNDRTEWMQHENTFMLNSFHFFSLLLSPFLYILFLSFIHTDSHPPTHALSVTLNISISESFVLIRNVPATLLFNDKYRTICETY